MFLTYWGSEYVGDGNHPAPRSSDEGEVYIDTQEDWILNILVINDQ